MASTLTSRCAFCTRPPRSDGRCAGCGRLLADKHRPHPESRDERPARKPRKRAATPSLAPAALPVILPPPEALAPAPVATVAVPAPEARDGCPLTEKYRPRDLSGVAGQQWIVCQLTDWLAAPHSVAYLFAGATGTGKTSTAVALARELGVNMADEWFGGLSQIASGEQTADSVRAAVRRLHQHPLTGSGWNVLIVNESDIMSAAAQAVWLDALENLPTRCCIVFTTNNAAKLPACLRDRCERFDFESSALLLAADLDAFAARIWEAETGRDDAPPAADFGPLVDESGDASFRRLLQLMEPAVRDARAGRPWRKRSA